MCYNIHDTCMIHTYIQPDILNAWSCGVLHNFTQKSLSSGSGQFQIFACGVSEIFDAENLWQWSQLEIRFNAFLQSTIPQKQFIFIINRQTKPYQWQQAKITNIFRLKKKKRKGKILATYLLFHNEPFANEIWQVFFE